MNRVALKMLVGDRGKYIAIILGIVFASMLMTQQMAVFVGLMARTFSFVSDLGQPDVWVMDPKVQFIDDIKPLQDTELYRVRGVEGVQWAVPLYKGMMKARLPDGTFQTCNVIGIDDATLIGGPPIMVQGKLEDLRQAEGIIVDDVGAKEKLAKHLPDGRTIPLQIGDTLELNDNRATVVGICKVTRTFQSQPVIYTTYSRATTFAPRERKLLSFILAEAQPGQDQQKLCGRIRQATGLAAYKRDDFKWLTVVYFMRNTGIPINIGVGVMMSFLVGTAIAGLTFYNFTMENLRHFGTLKAMGASNGMLLRMIILQSMLVGSVGYGLGVGAAALFGYASQHTEVAFLLLWQTLAISAGAVVIICVLAAVISIRQVMKLEPAIVFKG
ncbi:MAG: ABC transporter permease [Bacillota bacterium]